MGRFLVKGTCITPLRLNDTTVFEFEGVQIHASDLSVADAGGALHRGLFLDMLLSAPDLRSAMQLGGYWGDLVMDMLAFTHAVAVGPAEVLIAYDYEPDHLERGVFQYLPMPTGLLPTRRFKDDIFRLLWDALQHLLPEHRDRVLRAIAWYRKATMERYLLDRFSATWNGLEVMNPRMIEKHGLPEFFKRPCDNCGTVTRVPWSTGIRFALRRTSGDALWKDLHERRNGLIHGFKQIAQVVNDIEEPLRKGLDALRDSILDALNVPEERWRDFRKSAMTIPRPPRVRVEYALLDARLDAVPIGLTYPHLEFAGSQINREQVAEKRKETTSVSLDIVNYSGRFRPNSIEMEADRDPDDQEAKLELSL